MKLKVALVAAGTLAVGSVGYLIAGPLTPPGGSVASTYKTLSEVEPRIAINATNTPGNGTNVFVITQPGSYYLAANVSVPSGKNGILVSASRVTIDLNGFAIVGSTGSLEGITTAGGSPSHVNVRNGTIATCGSTGINLVWAPSCLIENVAFAGNKGHGLQAGNNTHVSNCSASNNTNSGFYSAGGTEFQDCTAYWNGSGFTSQQSDMYERCTAQYNTGIGFVITVDTKIINCQAIGNGQQGIVCTSDNWITGCQVHGNGGSNMAGIWATGVYNHIEGNDVVNNGYGIYVAGATNFIYRNKVGSSTQANFFIVAGNHVGTIGTASTNGSLINGSSGGGMGALESDPNANLIY